MKQKELMLAIMAIGIIYAIIIMGSHGANAAIPQNGQPQSTGTQGTPSAGGSGAQGGQTQDVYVRALNTGTYDNAQVTVSRGVPVRFHFSADLESGCGRVLYLPDFGVRLVSAKGEEQVATFTPTDAGTYPYRCGMNMFRGVMVVQ